MMPVRWPGWRKPTLEILVLRSFLIGLVAGQRGISPLAAIAIATLRKEVPASLPLQTLFLNPTITGAVTALAAAEMAGDKMKSAPDRIVPIGLAVRSITSAYAGAALAPKNQQALGAAVAMGTALVSSYIGWRLRCAAMARYGQTPTGLVEDAIVFTSGLAITNPKLFGTQALIEADRWKSGRRRLA
ncbi:MAG: rane protein [Devosia sp.]|nr:rane protein [Devosia sp.]